VRDELEAKGVRTYESDIPFVRRWIIDENIEIEPNPTRLYLDIEVDGREGLSHPMKAEKRILSIAMIDDSGEEHFFCDDNEHTLIAEFFDIAKRHALWLGWNSDLFDIPYLLTRAKKLDIPSPMPPCQSLDVMDVFFTDSFAKAPETKKLDYWSRRLLGRGKVAEYTPQQIYEMFLHNRDKLREYNLEDVRLVRDIDKLLRIIDARIETAVMAKLFYEQTGKLVYRGETLMGYGGRKQIVDTRTLMRALRRNPRPVYPRANRKHPKIRKAGAFIMKPKPGIHHNVVYLDYKSLYPTIVRTFNIGYETRVWGGKLEAMKIGMDKVIMTQRGYYLKTPRSVFAEELDELMRMRDEIKARMKKLDKSLAEYASLDAKQRALKIIMNSYIGVLGFEYSRFYHPHLFESVTLTGQWIIKRSIKICEELGVEVVYGDTDSVFVVLPENMTPQTFISLLNKKMRDAIIKTFGVPPEYYAISIKIDEMFEKIFFPAKQQKKRYVGLLRETREPNPIDPSEIKLCGRIAKVVGFEVKRRNVFDLAKKVQKKLFELIMSYDDPVTLAKQFIVFLQKIRDYLYAGAFDRLLVFRAGINKKLEKYKVDQPHVIVARELMKQGRLAVGDVVEYVIVARREGKLVPAPVVDGRIPQISLSGYDYYWERILGVVEAVIGTRTPNVATLQKLFTKTQKKVVARDLTSFLG